MIDPASRERAVASLLEKWPWLLGSTLIGGYALAAYGAARYSVDVDFVIPEKARKPIERWLADQGFARRSRRPVKGKQAFEATSRLVNGDVTLDLLIGFVMDRDARVKVPEPWIAMRARHARLDLQRASISRKVPVARPEALWALKLQAGREQDLTDLFSILATPVKSDEVRALFQSLRTAALDAKLARVKSRVEDPKLYNDSRSRMSLKDTDATRKLWERFKYRVAAMIPL